MADAAIEPTGNESQPEDGTSTPSGSFNEKTLTNSFKRRAKRASAGDELSPSSSFAIRRSSSQRRFSLMSGSSSSSTHRGSVDEPLRGEGRRFSIFGGQRRSSSRVSDANIEALHAELRAKDEEIAREADKRRAAFMAKAICDSRDAWNSRTYAFLIRGRARVPGSGLPVRNTLLTEELRRAEEWGVPASFAAQQQSGTANTFSPTAQASAPPVQPPRSRRPRRVSEKFLKNRVSRITEGDESLADLGDADGETAGSFRNGKQASGNERSWTRRISLGFSRTKYKVSHVNGGAA